VSASGILGAMARNSHSGLSAVLPVVLCLSAFVQAAQNPALPPRDVNRPVSQPSTTQIRGRIFAADTGQPLGRAQVTLTGAPAEHRCVAATRRRHRRSRYR
jgi:hypothetical protein